MFLTISMRVVPQTKLALGVPQNASSGAKGSAAAGVRIHCNFQSSAVPPRCAPALCPRAVHPSCAPAMCHRAYGSGHPCPVSELCRRAVPPSCAPTRMDPGNVTTYQRVPAASTSEYHTNEYQRVPASTSEYHTSEHQQKVPAASTSSEYPRIPYQRVPASTSRKYQQKVPAASTSSEYQQREVPKSSREYQRAPISTNEYQRDPKKGPQTKRVRKENLQNRCKINRSGSKSPDTNP